MPTLPKLSAVLGLALVVAGCVLSVDPVIPDSEATFDPRLVGTWEEQSGSDVAEIIQAANDGYAIRYTSDRKTSVFEARLGRLGDRLILDVSPKSPETDLPELYSSLLIGGHAILWLDVTADQVRTSPLDADAMLRAVRAGDIRLPYSKVGDRVVLQAATARLRSSLETYVGRPGVFLESTVWRRTTPQVARVEPPCFEAAAWREADQIFRRDPHWAGADVASSVDLGRDRILWLFGDTWIDPTGRRTRAGATMISNSVAIQTGTNPAEARMEFYWGRTADQKPAALFPDRGEERLWFGNGVAVGDHLILFFSRTISVKTGLGFDQVGWTAVMVENPGDDPPAWRVRALETPANPLGILVGSAAVVRIADYVYALGSQNPVKTHPIFAARWRTEQLHRGDLSNPEWWAGDRLGWVPDSSGAPRWPLFENAQAEITVHLDKATGRFLAVHSQGFAAADLTMRAAPTLTGPWTAPRLIYRPPEYYRPNVMIYAAKAHPHLSGGDLILTYATNSAHFADQVRDPSIYYPRFVRLTRCR